jgi:hypothetical protein
LHIGYWQIKSRRLFRVVIRKYDQSPTNSALVGRMFVMVLRRQNMALGYPDFSMASHAAVDACIGRYRARLVDLVESCVFRLLEIFAVFVESHD